MTPEERKAYRENLNDCLVIAYRAADYSQATMAKNLGVSRNSVRNWLHAHNIIEPTGASRQRLERLADPAEVVALKRKIARLEAESKSLQAQVKHSGTHQNLIDDVSAILQPVIDNAKAPAYNPPPKLKRSAADAVTLVWHLTDLHFGEIVDPNTIVGVNAYSPDIAANRVQYAWDTIRKMIADQPGGVDELVIAVNGDTIGGQIHPESTEYYAGVAIQMVAAAELLAQVIREAAGIVRKVRALGTVGNHPRSKVKQPTGRELVESSWEYGMHRHVEALVSDLPNVEYEVASGYILDTKIGPDQWAFSHGDAARGGGGALGIPAYALKRQHDANREWSLVIAEMTDAAASSVVKHSRYGHFHTYFYWVAGRADIGLMPSPKGTDSYVLNSLGRYGSPMFVVEVVHPEHGVIAQRAIDLTGIYEGDCRWDWTRAA